MRLQGVKIVKAALKVWKLKFYKTEMDNPKCFSQKALLFQLLLFYYLSLVTTHIT